MLKREDKYVLSDFIVNLHDISIPHTAFRHRLRVNQPSTLAELQDQIGLIIEETPDATSYTFTVVRKSVIQEEERSDYEGERSE
jgi:hypothetical protein